MVGQSLQNFAMLKGKLALRFDLKEEPVAARQQLHLAKQDDNETLEAYLQRALWLSPWVATKTPPLFSSSKWLPRHFCVVVSKRMVQPLL